MHTSELDELIEAFEAEKANFIACIKAAIDERDYLLADHCQQGLSLVRGELDKLYYFKNPLNDERRRRLEGMLRCTF